MIHSKNDWGRQQQTFHTTDIFLNRYFYIQGVFMRITCFLCAHRKWCNHVFEIPVASYQMSWRQVSELTSWTLELSEKKESAPTSLLWLRVIASSSVAILCREESIMNWNMPWFSHRNFPLSNRLNISSNEWHRLLKSLIIKIRIMTLFSTQADADSQGHSLFLRGFNCKKKQRESK